MTPDQLFLVTALTYLFHSTIAVCAVWLATRRMGSPRGRELAWKAALVLPLASTAFQVAAGYVAPIALQLPFVSSLSTTASVASLPSAAAEGGASFAAGSIAWTELLAGLWCLGAAYGVWRWIAAEISLRRTLRGRIEVIDDHAVDALFELRRRAGIRRRIRMSVSEDLDTPIAWGRREIVLSRRALEGLPSAQLAAVIAHELAHLERRDPLWFRSLALLEAFTFVSPLSFWAGRAQRRAAELAADDWARRQTGSGEDLARALAELAVHADDAWSPVASARGGSLVPRVERLLSAPAVSSEVRRPMASAGLTLGLLAGLALLAPGASAASPSEASASPEITGVKAMRASNPSELRTYSMMGRHAEGPCCGHEHTRVVVSPSGSTVVLTDEHGRHHFDLERMNGLKALEALAVLEDLEDLEHLEIQVPDFELNIRLNEDRLERDIQRALRHAERARREAEQGAARRAREAAAEAAAEAREAAAEARARAAESRSRAAEARERARTLREEAARLRQPSERTGLVAL